MTPFAWAITASFICTAAAAWFSGYVVGARVARKRVVRHVLRKRADEPFAETIQKRMDEEHGEEHGE